VNLVRAVRASGSDLATLERRIVILALTIIVVDGQVVREAPLVPVDPIPILLAIGAVCVALLTQRTAPIVAWVVTIAGMDAAASVAIAQSRAADPAVLTLDDWLFRAADAGLAAFLTLWTANAYATRPDRPVPAKAAAILWALLVWLAVGILITIVVVLAGQRPDPAFTWVDVATVPITWFVPFVAIASGIGIVADLAWGVERAHERLERSAAPADGGDRMRRLAAGTLEALVPGLAAAADATAAAERNRLAGDLHAVVVPSLRRAITEAETGGDPAAVLRHLRAADLELERLMADRWPVILESFGLVTALEDLAERLEATGSPPITLEVDRSEGRPPPPVERAGWRVAQVTLDNAVRHAAASQVTIRVAVGPDAVRMTITDDGRGFDPADPVRPGARGLADLARRASEVGGNVRISAGPESGTIVAFAWPGLA